MTISSLSNIEPASNETTGLTPANLALQPDRQDHFLTIRRLFAYGIPFALVGLALGLRFIAQKTIPHIVVPGDYVGFQDVVDGLPVPRLLDWNLGQIEFLEWVRDLSGPAQWLTSLLIFAPIWLYAVRQVNPTFRLFHPFARPPVGEQESATLLTSDSTPDSSPDPDTGDGDAVATSALSAPLEFHGLIKAGALFICLGLPALFLWLLVSIPEKVTQVGNYVSMAPAESLLIGKVWLFRILMLSLIFWVGFHRDGIAGDFTEAEWNRKRRIVPLMARAILFGLLAFFLCRLGLPQTLEDTLLRLQTLGSLNTARWHWVADRCLLSFSAIGFAIGTLFALIGRQNDKRRDQLVYALGTLVGFMIAWASLQPFSPPALASHFDVRPSVIRTIPENREYKAGRTNSGVPDTQDTAKELANQLHLSVGEQQIFPGRPIALFSGGPVVLAYQNGYTLDKLTPAPTSVTIVNRFLQDRNHETALGWSATKHLFNVALIHFDTTSAMDICLQDLTHNPHNGQIARSLSQMVSVCAASPQNLAILDRWTDSRNFSAPLRDTRRIVGDLYRRMGQPDRALTWYRKADMPSSFLRRVAQEQRMFHMGDVEGRLLFRGKPLAGVQVAVVPVRMNGLPAGTDTQVLRAWSDIFDFRRGFPLPGFDSYHPVPFQFRWLSAGTTTDADGHYKLSNLTEGAYLLICTLPSELQVSLPYDSRLKITDPPVPFTLNYTHPRQEMGTTKIEF